MLLRGNLNDQIESKTRELQYQCNTLSRQLSKSGYLDGRDNSAVNSALSVLSDVYDGRILVVNKAFRIEKDTYSIDEGKLNISESVLKCFQGESVVEYSEKNKRIQITIPVYNLVLTEVIGVMVVTSSTGSIMDMVNGYADRAGVIDIVMLILSVFLAFFLSLVLVRPFKRVTDALNKAAFGDLEPVEVNDCVETQKICDAYNKTLTKLKTLDESRQEFVSNVSHELKTPITSIRVLADSLMSMEDAPIELYREFLSDISDEIDRESTIIDDLLSLVKLDKSNMELKVTQVSINDLLELV